MAISTAASKPRTTGWIHANLFVLGIAVISIVYVAARELGANVIAFVMWSTLFGGLGLTALSSWRTPSEETTDRQAGINARTGRPTILAIAIAPLTWAVGGLHILMEGAYFMALSELSPAETAVLIRLSVPLSMLIGLGFLSRYQSPRGWLGCALIAFAVISVVLSLDASQHALGIACGLAASLIVTLRAFATEYHPHNQSAGSTVEKMRTTGIVVLITGAALTIACVSLTALVALGAIQPIAALPQAADFLHTPTILLALLVGAALFTSLTYLQFSAVAGVGTENFLAITVFVPIAVAVAQAVSALAGIVDVPVLDVDLLPAIALVVVGSILVIGSSKGR